MSANRRGPVPSILRSFAGFLHVAALAVCAAACGGSSSGSNPPPPVAPVVSLPASLSFGTVLLGATSPPMSVTLTNTGTAPLAFTSNPALSGANAADFSITAATCSTAAQVAANASCTVTLTFKPTLLTENATLTFSDNAANSPQTVAVAGTAAQMLTNVIPLTVDAGPVPNITFDANVPFISVTVCVPGTATCQTIDHIVVDTGSEGLRLLSPPANITLPQVMIGANNLASCVSFLDTTFLWGPVQLADVQLGGETASNVPVQIVEPPGFSAVPNACSAMGTDIGNVNAFGGNGIIGVGPFLQDCGSFCVTQIPTSPNIPPYFTCVPNTNTCAPATVALASQIQNPVSMLPAPDNNGVVVQLPPVGSTGAPTVTGSLILGIGTQGNNGLGSAILLAADNFGNITTTFNGTMYTGSFIDSGSNGIFLLDAAHSGLPDCATNQAPGFSCPNGTIPFSVVNSSNRSPAASAPASFSIANALTLFNANGGLNTGFNNLGGPFGSPPLEFDFGLSFFFGRSVFTGIEGRMGPTGVSGPYFAY